MPIWGYQAPASLKPSQYPCHGQRRGPTYLGLSSPSLIEARLPLLAKCLAGPPIWGYQAPASLKHVPHSAVSTRLAAPIWGYQAPASLKRIASDGLAAPRSAYLGLSSPSLIEAISSGNFSSGAVPYLGLSSPSLIEAGVYLAG